MKSIVRIIRRIFTISLEWLIILIIPLAFGLKFSAFQTYLVNQGARLFFNNELRNLSVELIDLSSNGDLILRNVSFKVDGFSINIQKGDMDLTISDLPNIKFIGNSISLDGVDMVVSQAKFPSTDTTQFQYASIPFIQFDEVNIAHTSLLLAKRADVDTLLFPSVKSHDFTFNDSIIAKDLTYADGLIHFVSDSTAATTDYETNEVPHLIIPHGVPKFSVNEFIVNNLSVASSELNSDKAERISSINFELAGWSNIEGADLELKSMDAMIRDSMHVAIDTKEMLLQADESFELNDFVLNTNLVDIDMKCFDIERREQGLFYSTEISKLSAAPQIWSLLPNDIGIEKEKLPTLDLAVKANYFLDNLTIDWLTISNKSKSKIGLKGNIKNLKKLEGVQIETTEFNVNSSDLAHIVGDDFPAKQLNRNLGAQFDIHSKGDQLFSNGFIEEGSNRINITLKTTSLKKSQIGASIQLRSNNIDLAALSRDSTLDITTYNTNITANIQDINNVNGRTFNINLKSDSLVKKDLHLNDVAADFVYNNQAGTTFKIASEEQNWKLRGTTKNDILRDEIFDFNGDMVLSTFNYGDKKLINGAVVSDLSGRLDISNKFSIGGALNHMVYTPANKESYEAIDLAFKYNTADSISTVSISSEDIIDFNAQYHNAMLTTKFNVDTDISNLPQSYLRISANIDTIITQQLLGQRYGLSIKDGQVSTGGNGTLANVSVNDFYLPDVSIASINLMVKPKENELIVKLDTEELSAAGASFSVLGIRSILKSNLSSGAVSILGVSKELGDDFELNTKFNQSDYSFSFEFSKLNAIRVGKETWDSDPNVTMNYTKKGEFIGELLLTKDKQVVELIAANNYIKGRLKDFEMGRFLRDFTSYKKIDSKIDLNLSYGYDTEQISSDLLFKEIVIDTISVGQLRIQLDADKQKQISTIEYDEKYGYLKSTIQNFYETPTFDLSLKHVYLDSLKNIASAFIGQKELTGIIDGEISGSYADYLSLQGQLNFDSIYYSLENGTDYSIDNQAIYFNNDRVDFNAFKIVNNESNGLLIDGEIGLRNFLKTKLRVNSDEFKVLNNLGSAANFKGEVSASIDLDLIGDLNGMKISGIIKTKDGNNIDYYYKGAVQLEDNISVVQFSKPPEHQSIQLFTEPANSSYPISYNVDLDIGNTDMYVLLSKTANEYFRMEGGGKLSLVGKDFSHPEIFGEIKSSTGRVYYELPVVSTVELEILSASMRWTGDVSNPVISFAGEEVFNITQNEISAQLSNAQKKVPVHVTVQIDEKTLEDLELDLNLYSEDQETNGLLSSLPSETKTNYALDMLIYGKINRKAEGTSTGYEPVVNKLNELSRRNLKDADLRFTVDSKVDEANSTQEKRKTLGYSFSKKLLEDKLKVSIGGAFNLNNNSQHSEKLFGEISIEYMLMTDPEIKIDLTRENFYNGPIDGDVDQSSIKFEYEIVKDNMFIDRIRKKYRKIK